MLAVIVLLLLTLLFGWVAAQAFIAEVVEHAPTCGDETMHYSFGWVYVAPVSYDYCADVWVPPDTSAWCHQQQPSVLMCEEAHVKTVRAEGICPIECCM